MTPLKNPLPTDFRTNLHKTVREQMAIYSVGRHTVCRWRRISNITAYQRAWNDEEIDTLKTLVESGMSYNAIAREMKSGAKRITNAIHRFGLKQKTVRTPTRPVPDDFVELWADHPVTWLCKHYSTSTKTIRRWVAEKRLKRVRGTNVRAVAKDFQRQAPERVKRYKKDRYNAGPVDRPVRDESVAGRAADFLRKFSGIHKCDADGHFSHKGTYWRRGSSVLTADDVIERAEYLGFRANAWLELAA